MEENTDPKAAIIVTGEIVLDSLLKIWTVFFFYNGTEPPAGVFTGFESLDTITDSTKTRTYSDFVSCSLANFSINLAKQYAVNIKQRTQYLRFQISLQSTHIPPHSLTDDILTRVGGHHPQPPCTDGKGPLQ